MKYILPNPFNLSTYGQDNGQAYNRIININGANENASHYFPSNQLTQNCTILPPITWTTSSQSMSNPSNHIIVAQSMQNNVIENLNNTNFDIKKDELVVIGGDHTISIGTGAFLSGIVDMSEVGLIWIDAHGDFNTPETSESKSLTGYPCAINNGLGLKEFLKPFNNNFIQKIVQIGIRDIDILETNNLKHQNIKTFSNLDIEDLGMANILTQTLKELESCKYIWLSMDIDSLDPIYCDEGRTDVPVTGGLTPREFQYIARKIHQSGKLRISEIVQINNSDNNSNLVYLANRTIEILLGLGKFRINE